MEHISADGPPLRGAGCVSTSPHRSCAQCSCQIPVPVTLLPKSQKWCYLPSVALAFFFNNRKYFLCTQNFVYALSSPFRMSDTTVKCHIFYPQAGKDSCHLNSLRNPSSPHAPWLVSAVVHDCEIRDGYLDVQHA